MYSVSFFSRSPTEKAVKAEKVIKEKGGGVGKGFSAMRQQKQADEKRYCNRICPCTWYLRGVSARNSKHFLPVEIALNSKNWVFIVSAFEKNKNSFFPLNHSSI